MKALTFHSTRADHVNGKGGPLYTVGEAIETGLAPDGGLFIPSEIPKIDFDALPASSFLDCSIAFLSQWLANSEFEADLESLVRNALNFEVPIVQPEVGTYILELFHGPTLSFKDFGARLMSRLLGHRLARSGRKLTIMVATSGDTGSAVADGFSGIPGISVLLLYPRDGVSPVQEQQLILQRPGVRALQVDGSFDDCQRLVKGALSDPSLEGLHISTANSINIGRLLPQMLYYVWAVKSIGCCDIRVVVPSGNLGNITAGIWAHLSGMPAAGFIAAHNENDFFPSFLVDSSESFRPSVKTISNAMDVGAPSNFERLKALMPSSQLKGLVHGCSVSDKETLISMKEFHDATGYLADPHTAVGLEAARRFRSLDKRPVPTLVLSTAHPSKFPETCKMIGLEARIPDQLVSLADRPSAYTELDCSQDSLRKELLDQAGI